MSSIVSALQSLGTDLSSVFGGSNNVGNVANAQFGTPYGNNSGAAIQNAMQGPVTPTGGTQTGATPTTPSPVSNLGPIGRLYLQYQMAKRLRGPSFVGGHSTPVTQQPPFSPFAQTPAAIMPPQVQL